MPLLKRKPVVLFPIPPPPPPASTATTTTTTTTPSQERQVYFLQATGEIFNTYAAYAQRYTYLRMKIFQCEASGKTGLDYFSALASERDASRTVRERFPDQLKRRVLSTVHFQIMGRLDSLVEIIFDRYRDRFFTGEQVYVDLSGDKYFARISKIFPPASVRATIPAVEAGGEAAAIIAAPEAAPVASTSTAIAIDAPVVPVVAPLDPFNDLAHKIGVDLNIEVQKAREQDDPDEYLYTVQLMDEDHKFAGSFMEVKGKALTRDRLSFSRSILKRYIRECVQRTGGLASPWMVKPTIAVAAGLSVVANDEVGERNRLIKEEKIAKRKKSREENEGPTKRRRKDDDGNSIGGPGSPSSTTRPLGPPPARGIKYPIEDLDLDPMTIHDGRILRRLNSELPPLPTKPVPTRELSVGKELWNEFVMVWNMLNIYSKPLNLTTFSIDDFARALTHSTLTPPCSLLVEIHGSILNLIATDPSRVLGSTTAAPLPAHLLAGANGPLAAVAERVNSSSPAPSVGKEEQEDEDEEGDVTMNGNGNGNGVAGTGTDASLEEEQEIDRLVRKGMSFAKKWDRMGKLKVSDGRKGWERHLIGALCSRGAPITMERLPAILAHLLEGSPSHVEDTNSTATAADIGADPTSNTVVAPVVEVQQQQVEDDSMEIDELASPVIEPLRESTSASTSALLPPSALPPLTDPNSVVIPDIEAHYLTLSPEDKLEIISYLCTLALGSKGVHLLLEESESMLTEGRKDRADVNKERRAILEKKLLLDKPPAKPTTTTTEEGGGGATTTNGTPSRVISRATSIAPLPSSSPKKATTTAAAAANRNSKAGSTNGGEEEDELEVAEEEDPEQEKDDEDDEEEDQLADDYVEEDEETRPKVGAKVSRASTATMGGRTLSLRNKATGRRGSSRGTSIDGGEEEDEEEEEEGEGGVDPTTLSERQILIASKKIEQAKAKTDAKGRQHVDRIRAGLEEELAKNMRKDDHVEREFRRHYGVARCRPLGKDRFFNRYWWFDGIGGMTLVGNEGARYSTARLYVQGPAFEDCQVAKSHLVVAEGEDAEGEEAVAVARTEELKQRRVREEGDHGAVLEVDEWAAYETEEELEGLLAWLNSKGSRELALKNTLIKWKAYILAGFQKRATEPATAPLYAPVVAEPSTNGRRSRARGNKQEKMRIVQEDVPMYLHYVNRLARN